VGQIPIRMALSWGVGTLLPSILFNTTAFLLLRFLTDYVGVAAGTAGLLIMFAKLYDMAANPLMGSLSDRLAFPGGRRRPWLLVGGAIAVAGFLALFHAASAANTLAALAALLLYSTGYTVFNVPYMAMPAEMSGSYHERTRLMSFRVYTIAVGTFIGGALAPWLIAHFGGGLPGHRQMSAVLGALAFVAALVCFFGTAGAPATTAVSTPPLPWHARLGLLAGNRPFRLLLGTKVLQLFSLASSQATMAYFLVLVLGRSYRDLAAYSLAGSVAIFLSQPLWLALSRRFGKSRAYSHAAAAYALLTLTWLLAGANEPDWAFFARAAGMGALSGGLLLMGQSLLPDTIEFDHLRTGQRREGLLAGLYSMAEKVAGALGAATTGLMLAAFGYVASRTGNAVQPASAILGVKLCLAVIPAMAMLASCVVLARYDLDEAALQRARTR
jgi:glycoside/pentoside/hexuronide:cation symporter, GPH family